MIVTPDHGMAALAPERVDRIVSISAAARSHPQSIAMRFVQRQAVMADPDWQEGHYYGVDIDPALFEAYGVTGPNARAGGVAKDLRKDAPYLAYDRLDFDVALEQDSDIHARARVRFRDLRATIDLIRQILARMPQDGPVMAPRVTPSAPTV